MSNSITITKRSNGDYVLTGPNEEAAVFEQAYHVVTKVREWLNFLRLPPETVTEAETK